MSYRLLKVSALSAIPSDYSIARSDLFQATIGTELAGVPLSSVKVEFSEYAAYLNSTTNTNATWVSAGIDIYSNNTGNVGVGGPNPGEKLSVSGNLSAAGGLSAIGPSSHNHFAGRVGIGALPGQQTLFEIASSGSLSQGTGMRIVDTNDSGSQYIGFDSTINTESMAFYIRHYNANSTLSGDVVIGNAGAIRHRDGGVATGHTMILTGGDVGIGTDIVPLRKLHVAGTAGDGRVKIENTGTNSSTVIDLDNDAATSEFGIYGGTADSFQIWHGVKGGALPRLTIKTGGFVGVGVTDPQQILDVDGTVKIQNGNAATNHLTIDAPANFNVIGTAQPWRMRFGGTDRFRFEVVSSKARLGIDTTTPNAELDVSGTGAIIIPVGTNAQRPSDTNALGMTAELGQIRYNTESSSYEGYGSGSKWASLGGVKDIDGDTYISAEDNPGDDNDELDFYVGGSSIVYISGGGDAQLSPTSDSHTDLGTSTKRWKTIYVDDLDIGDDVIIADLLKVGGYLQVGSTNVPDYTLDVAGDIGVDAHIFHNGNANTYMHFGTDTWKVRTGGSDRVDVTNSVTTIKNTLTTQGDVNLGNDTGDTTTCAGQLIVTAHTSLNGGISLGDAADDGIAVNGSISTSIIPAGTSGEKSLGGTDARWDAYIDRLWVTNTGVVANLNADQLDSLDSTQFLRSDVNDSASGIVTFSKQIKLTSNSNGDGSGMIINTTTKDATAYAIDLQRSGVTKAYIDYDGDAKFKSVLIGTYTPWTNGNDGDGTGLHADILDGWHASSASGDRWGHIPVVDDSGAMEIGKYIDFHTADGDTGDYDLRLYADSGKLYFQDDDDPSGNQLLTTKDEGKGNGIDADTVDGHHEAALGGSLVVGTGGNANEIFLKAVDGSTNLGYITVPYATSASDADTVDSLHASSFLRSDANDTTSGQLIITGGAGASGSTSDAGLVIRNTKPTLKFEDTGGDDDFWLHVNNSIFYLQSDRNDPQDAEWEAPIPLEINTLLDTGKLFGNLILTQADEGSGNNLDADTTDGYHLGSGAGVKVGTLAAGTAPVPNTSTYPGYIYASGDIVFFYSDRRLKTNVAPISDALHKVNQLNGFTYNSNELARTLGGYEDQDERRVGVFADEVEKVLPEAVKLAGFDAEFDDDGEMYSMSGDNYKTVQYEKLIPLLIESIKELTAKVEKLERR